MELTLEERPLGREVEALVEQLGPLLAQVVTQGADAAVEDAKVGVSGGRGAGAHACDLQALDRDVSEAEDGDGRRVVCSLLANVNDHSGGKNVQQPRLLRPMNLIAQDQHLYAMSSS